MEKFEKLLEDVAIMKERSNEWGALKEEVAIIKVDTEQSKEQIQFLTQENAELRRKLDDLAQYSRKGNVIIQRIPF